MKIRNKEHATSKIGRVYKARVARRMLSQPALAGWKEKSIYRGDKWWISRIKCVPGEYVPKERV